ncbi:MAG: hypothetical protein ABSB40_01385 [Nitrososphaeria archaeon]
MKTFSIVAGLGLLVLILASPMPWLSISLFSTSTSLPSTTTNDQYNLMLADIFKIIINTSYSFPTTNMGIFLNTLIQILLMMRTMIAATLLYFASIILGTLSIAYRKISLFAGVFSIMTGLLWILGVDSVRSELVSEAGSQSGSLQPLIEKGVFAIVMIGYGVFVVILVGIIFFIAYFLEDRVLKSSQLTTYFTGINSEVKASREKYNKLTTNIDSIKENYLKLSKDYSEIRKEHEGIISILLKCRVENAYVIGDRLYTDVRNTGSLPINWIELVDIEPRPKGTNLPSGQIQLLGGINPGAAVKFSYDLKDIYGKSITFDPYETYNIKLSVGWAQTQQAYDLSCKVTGSGSQFRAEIDGGYTTGNNLILNIKNNGFSKITQEKITSIAPSPGGSNPPAQSTIINPGETKTLWFTCANGAFVPNVTYTLGLELSDGTNTYSLSFVVLAS